MLRWLRSYFGDNSNDQIIGFLEAENDRLWNRIDDLREGIHRIMILYPNEIDMGPWIARDILEADDLARDSN